MKKILQLVAVMVVLAGAAVWLWAKSERDRCEKRGKAYADRMETIRVEEQKQLPPGSNGEDIRKFFHWVGVEPDFDATRGEVKGTVLMQACSPGWYCGDAALIGITVHLDSAGKVASSDVMGMYTNCL